MTNVYEIAIQMLFNGDNKCSPTFQRNIELMLNELLWKCCVVYIDDIIIFSNTLKKHLQHLKEVFKRLKQCFLVIKLSKCKLLKKNITYLGHVVGNGSLKPDPVNIQAILNTLLLLYCNKSDHSQ